MKKIIWLFLFLLTFNCVFATELKGGVSFSVNSAREYVQGGIPAGITIPENYYQLQEDNVERQIISYNNQRKIVGITVLYFNEPDKAYIYNQYKKLIYIDKYDKPVDIYPHRGYRYNLDGKLILTSLTVSKNELFRFDTEGNLIAHSINGIIYDENGNIIGKGK